MTKNKINKLIKVLQEELNLKNYEITFEEKDMEYRGEFEVEEQYMIATGERCQRVTLYLKKDIKKEEIVEVVTNLLLLQITEFTDSEEYLKNNKKRLEKLIK